MGRGKAHRGFSCGNLKEGDDFEDSGLDVRIILKWILEKWDGGHGLDSSGSGQGQVAGCCECGNELLGFMKCGKFEYLRTC